MSEISKEILKNIRRIQIQTTRSVNDVLAGAYHSAFKGRGIEFEDVREYQPGDEVRSIDWNVTARMQYPYIKNFREERELTVLLVVDVSASSQLGSQKRLKSELIAEIGAVLAFSAIQNNDRVGLLLFSDKIEKYIPPKKGVRHVLRTIRELLVYEPSHKKTDIAQALSFLGNVQKRQGVCFLISDFISPNYKNEIALTAKLHDLITIAITDPVEVNLPKMGLVRFLDLETEETCLVDSSSLELHDYLEKEALAHLEEHKKLMRKIKAGFISIRTDLPYIDPIKSFFEKRQRLRR